MAKLTDAQIMEAALCEKRKCVELLDWWENPPSFVLNGLRSRALVRELRQRRRQATRCRLAVMAYERIVELLAEGS